MFPGKVRNPASHHSRTPPHRQSRSLSRRLNTSPQQPKEKHHVITMYSREKTSGWIPKIIICKRGLLLKYDHVWYLYMLDFWGVFKCSIPINFGETKMTSSILTHPENHGSNPAILEGFGCVWIAGVGIGSPNHQFWDPIIPRAWIKKTPQQFDAENNGNSNFLWWSKIP